MRERWPPAATSTVTLAPPTPLSELGAHLLMPSPCHLGTHSAPAYTGSPRRSADSGRKSNRTHHHTEGFRILLSPLPTFESRLGARKGLRLRPSLYSPAYTQEAHTHTILLKCKNHLVFPRGFPAANALHLQASNGAFASHPASAAQRGWAWMYAWSPAHAATQFDSSR